MIGRLPFIGMMLRKQMVEENWTWGNWVKNVNGNKDIIILSLISPNAGYRLPEINAIHYSPVLAVSINTPHFSWTLVVGYQFSELGVLSL